MFEPTPERIRLLECGFLGPRPGSNAFPLLQLGKDASRIDGEELDAMIRKGWLEASPAKRPDMVKGGNAGPYGEIPDVDLVIVYRLTDAGRKALLDRER